MEDGKYSFAKRILIDGMAYPMSFVFRMLSGAYPTKYKVRTANPTSDFNMYYTVVNNTFTYLFEDITSVPGWLRGDKNAQRKLSDAILSVQ